MQYFDIPAIRKAIVQLQNYSANWLISGVCFAANDVGTDGLVNMAGKLGTDRFWTVISTENVFGIQPFSSGNNLLRPRLKGIKWDTGAYANDYIIRQDTKMWATYSRLVAIERCAWKGLLKAKRQSSV